MKALKLTVKITMYALVTVICPLAALGIGIAMALDWANA